MPIKTNIEAFIELGFVLQNFTENCEYKSKYKPYLYKFNQLIETEKNYNQWFVKENILFAVKAIANELTNDNFNKWLGNYNLKNTNVKNIGVVTAGNIPLVGFHDFLSVLILNHNFIGKLSSKDNRLLKFVADLLIFINPKFKDKITFVDKLASFDAIIATGSDNSARYFDYYFGKFPNIIRKNRSSVAILNGNETLQDIDNLGIDIFSYFGLGCRNVSKIFIPENYDLHKFFEPLEKYYEIINHNKYANNYDYNRVIYMMNNIKIYDNNFLILKEDIGFSSPIAVVYFEYYKNIDKVKKQLKINSDNLQCIVSNIDIDNKINFGQTQKPKFWDYADNIDTIKFLLNL